MNQIFYLDPYHGESLDFSHTENKGRDEYLISRVDA